MQMEVRRETTRRLEIFRARSERPAYPHPVLFVHGAFTAAWCWTEHFLPWFAGAGFDAWAVSLRGHGGSHGREGLLLAGIADYVEDLHEAVAHIGAPPVLVGHSMGGFVVQKYLEDEKAPAVVLMASTPPQGLLASQLQLAFGNPSLFAQLNSVLSHGKGSAEALRKALFAGELPPEKLREFFRNTQPESQRAIWDMTLFSLPRVWAMAKPPALWLAAEKDALFALEQMRIGAGMLGIPLEVVPGIGHAMMLDAGWEGVAARIAGWLRRTAAAA
ncbi:MAG: alpha/beta fold hydrolase [Burkholderiales bacterium]|nr:alpha/beta fold hydrolase [Burkholderiales bacterium]